MAANPADGRIVFTLSLSRPQAAAQWIRDIGSVDLDTEWNQNNRQPPFGIESVRLPAVPVKLLVHTNVTCARDLLLGGARFVDGVPGLTAAR